MFNFYKQKPNNIRLSLGTGKLDKRQFFSKFVDQNFIPHKIIVLVLKYTYNCVPCQYCFREVSAL